METLAERYILLDSLLFKIITLPEKWTAISAIPEICPYKIITLYNSSLFAGHQGIIKIFDYQIFIQCLIHNLHSYIQGYHICQLSHNEKLPTRQLQMRFNLIKGHYLD